MTPVLYILMRTDMDSMNPGKAMAQASHASNAFVSNAEPGYNVDEELFNAWQQSTTQGFGTVLVLGVNEAQKRPAVEVAESNLELPPLLGNVKVLDAASECGAPISVCA